MKKVFFEKIINQDKVIFFLVISLLTMVYTYKIGQDSNFDLLNYHFFTGYSYLTERSEDIAPANIQSFTHPAMNVLAYIAFDKLVFPFGAWLILFVQLLSIPALLVIADEISFNITGKKVTIEKNIALLLCVISPLWLSELGTSFFSSTTTPLVLWSLYFIIKKNNKLIIEGILSGILMGLALGLKLTNAPFVIGSLCALFVKVMIERNSSFKFLISFAVGGLIGVTLTSHWYWELWATWGNPLFPFYNKVFKSQYFDLINWRDTRWMFHGMMDYVKFSFDANHITGKTSEVPFKDSRIIFISIAPFLFLAFIRSLVKNRSIIFITFFFISYFLWAVLFAYQRYAIPLEIMYGLIIWIGINSLTGNKIIKSILLICIIIGCASHFKIPNWGHIQPSNVEHNPFSLSFPANFNNEPALYLVDGVTISHVLSYLSPDSKFYGMKFSDKINPLVKQALTVNKNMPVRIITTENEIKNLPLLQSQFGLDNKDFVCSEINSSVGKYIICSVEDKKYLANKGDTILDINYMAKKDNREGKTSISPIVYAEGLSDYEQNGRWTAGREVNWNFSNCLKDKNILLILLGSAYGPNIGKPFVLHAAGKAYPFIVENGIAEVRIKIKNENQECINSIQLDIPAPTSPSEIGESGDTRKLGLLIQRVVLKSN